MKALHDRLKKELNSLVSKGRNLYYVEAIKKGHIDEESKKSLFEIEKFKDFYNTVLSTQKEYQKWFTLSLPVVKQIAPERYDEFRFLYKLDKRNESKIDFITYTISDYFMGLAVSRGYEEVVNPFNAYASKFDSQNAILESCQERLESSIVDIEGVLQSDLFDGEIEAANELLKKKHIRASGMLVGVTLEGHLKHVCKNYSISFRKKNPTISDFNEELKKENIIDVPTWRLIQRLGDIRNLCAHPKEREPQIDEIEDLIRGTKKLIAELY